MYLPAQDVDTLRVVLERSELSSEDLQGLQNLSILQILQVLLLQQQELHTLSRGRETRDFMRNTLNREGRQIKWNYLNFLCNID